VPRIRHRRKGRGAGFQSGADTKLTVDRRHFSRLNETGFTFTREAPLGFDLSILAKHVPFLLEGLWLTTVVCLGALAGSIVLGIVVAACRTAASPLARRL
jgi:ABC-type amino acid transport system permease subunit